MLLDFLKKIFLSILLLVITSCGVENDQECHFLKWQEQKKILEKYSEYTIYGKAIIKKNGKADFIGFKLNHDKDRTTINLSGPLSIPIAIIEEDKAGSHLKIENKIENFKVIMQDELGFYLKPSSIGKLLLGLPQMGKYSEYLNHYPKQQNHTNYTVEWLGYSCFTNNFQPRKLKISTKNDTSIVIIIRSIEYPGQIK